MRYWLALIAMYARWRGAALLGGGQHVLIQSGGHVRLTAVASGAQRAGFSIRTQLAGQFPFWSGGGHVIDVLNTNTLPLVLLSVAQTSAVPSGSGAAAIPNE